MAFRKVLTLGSTLPLAASARKEGFKKKDKLRWTMDDVSDWLESIGLGEYSFSSPKQSISDASEAPQLHCRQYIRYILPFTWHAVNGAILGEMKEADLIVLGVSDVEQRRKLLRLFDLYPDDHSSGSSHSMSLSLPKNPDLYRAIEAIPERVGLEDLLASSSTSEIEDPLTVKVRNGDETTTVAISALSTFAEVEALLRTRLGMSKGTCLKMVDEDGDKISLRNEQDWSNCLTLLAGRTMLLHVVEDLKTSTTRTPNRHSANYGRITTTSKKDSPRDSPRKEHRESPRKEGGHKESPRVSHKESPRVKESSQNKTESPRHKESPRRSHVKESPRSSQKESPRLASKKESPRHSPRLLSKSGHVDHITILTPQPPLQKQHVVTAPDVAFAAFDSLPHAIVVIDTIGIIQYLNETFERLSGYTRSELFSRDLRILMTPEIAIHHNEYMQNYLASGIARVIGRGRDVILVTKDQVFRAVHLAVTENRSTGATMFVGTMTEKQRSLGAADQSLIKVKEELQAHFNVSLLAASSELLGSRFAWVSSREAADGKSLLGVGSMGSSYLAVDTKMAKSLVAIKIFPVSGDSEAQALQKELHKLSLYAHTHLVRIVAEPILISLPTVAVCLPYEFASEGNLSQYLSNYKSTGLPTSIKRVVLLGMAEGLQYLHEVSLLHGNLKLSNVLIFEGNIVKLVDFSKSAIQEAVTSRKFEADPFFAAPEVLSGWAPGRPADIFALGLLMLFVLAVDDQLPKQSPVQQPASLNTVWTSFVRATLAACGEAPMTELILKMGHPLPLERPNIDQVIISLATS